MKKFKQTMSFLIRSNDEFTSYSDGKIIVYPSLESANNELLTNDEVWLLPSIITGNKEHFELISPKGMLAAEIDTKIFDDGGWEVLSEFITENTEHINDMHYKFY